MATRSHSRCFSENAGLTLMIGAALLLLPSSHAADLDHLDGDDIRKVMEGLCWLNKVTLPTNPLLRLNVFFSLRSLNNFLKQIFSNPSNCVLRNVLQYAQFLYMKIGPSYHHEIAELIAQHYSALDMVGLYDRLQERGHRNIFNVFPFNALEGNLKEVVNGLMAWNNNHIRKSRLANLMKDNSLKRFVPNSMGRSSAAKKKFSFSEGIEPISIIPDILDIAKANGVDMMKPEFFVELLKCGVRVSVQEFCRAVDHPVSNTVWILLRQRRLTCQEIDSQQRRGKRDEQKRQRRADESFFSSSE